MIDTNDELHADLERTRQIPVIPVMLDVICQTTGLGFAALARVTDTRWMACSVLDHVQFGLKEGSELKLETTICDEIRGHHEPVIIDHVAKDERYKNHHTPKTYGLQSYISYPIILKNGNFFGTLCAMGSEPAQLNNPKIIGMFALFTDLLSFHLESIDYLHKSEQLLKETNKQLMRTNKENSLYQQISSHHLQEPLRKIRVFSDILVNHTHDGDVNAAKETARKIHSFANELSGMINHLADFSAINQNEKTERIDLNAVLEDVIMKLHSKIEKHHAKIESEELPVISANTSQMSLLLYHLLEHVIIFSNAEEQYIKISVSNLSAENGFYNLYIEQDNNFEKMYDPDAIFDLFIHVNESDHAEKYRAGLAICQKIAHNHGGELSVYSVKDSGVSFCLKLPISGIQNKTFSFPIEKIQHH